ncbi:hypothetical protein H310_00375 [Aphanomyces invadans]|uniref:Myosin motor domain-containing protein n=1 Tax=Aphanomyces invadans TaxID=157072 RepID=A0A024UUF4_9STRA|nr:hypothetical protein H310_00375 [Aphanomyces invadans]ETW09954.1 hypothetical protein H310_00375 [Aphanomyces invadans]|eukprot:XP_008861365.1 hypothetical protein H310_00375 [Aphanomyces invadans]
MEGVKVFIPDKEHVWLPASVKSIEGSLVTVKIEDIETGVAVPNMSMGASLVGKVVSVDLSKPDIVNVIQARTVKSSTTNTTISLPLQNKVTSKTHGFEDMISVDHLHEGAILYNLRQRFFSHLPYTYTGKICIAVNPYQWLSLYSPDTMQMYMDGSRENKAPHVYAVSMESFFHMRTHTINQSILVSGESGAGKTETTKIMMNHVATLSSSTEGSDAAQSSIIHRIIQSNPLLESFGNAATTRNDNSSRFGKFTELQFNPRGHLMGARAHTYLLEKSRVCHQAPGERTFHIFYQVLAEAAALPQLHLKSSHQYRYVQQDKLIELEHTWSDTKEGLTIVGIADSMQLDLLRVLAAILHLGESDFEMVQGDVDSSQVKDKTALTTAADLLGLPFTNLEKVLTFRSVIVGREVISKPMTVDQARDCRDAVAKSLYSSMFTWLVDQINAAIGVSHFSHFIGILDIFGFEAFEHNSFEQLCINYANEKLQQKFVQDVLKTVQAEYEEEGISWHHVNFADNQDVLDLIEGRLGVLSLLNEESSLATGTDASFAHKLSAVMANHARFETPRLHSSAFIILHYAGKVLYDTNGFLDKHRDALLPDIKKVLGESSVDLVRTMFPTETTHRSLHRQSSSLTANHHSKHRPGVAATRAVTVGSQFKESLARLMDKISHTNVHYVRCIKPNSVKSPNVFHHESIVDQLRCAGVIEAIRVSRSAYPSRLPHVDCIKRYAILAPPALASRLLAEIDFVAEPKAQCGDLMAHLFPNGHVVDYQVGLSRVYFRESILDDLDKRRGFALRRFAIRIQTRVKMFLARKHFLNQRKAIILVQTRVRGFVQRSKYRRVLRGVVKLQALVRGRGARKVVHQLRRVLAATRFQSVVRMHRQRKQYLRTNASISIIQSFWRNTYIRRKLLKRMAQEKQQRALGSKVLHLQTQLGGGSSTHQASALGSHSGHPSSPPQSATNRASITTRLFDESSQVLGTLVAENEALRERVARQESEINALKEENRKMKEALQAKEVEDKVKNLSQKSQEASQVAYLSLLEEEYEKLRGFVCHLFDLPADVGLVRAQSSQKELTAPNDSTMKPTNGTGAAPPMADMTAAKHDAYTLLHRSATRIQRLRSKEGTNPKRGSARRVKDYWDEIKTTAPPLPYTLGSTPWKRLLTDWAQGNPKKLEYMNRWLQNVLEGGDVEHGGFPLGVELKSVTPMMLEGFIQLVIPKLAERQDVKVHVHTKEFIGTSMRITLEVKEGVPKMTRMPLKEHTVPQAAKPRESTAGLDQWGRNSIMSVRETNISNFSFASNASTADSRASGVKSPSPHPSRT